MQRASYVILPLRPSQYSACNIGKPGTGLGTRIGVAMTCTKTYIHSKIIMCSHWLLDWQVHIHIIYLLSVLQQTRPTMQMYANSQL